ncbi:hypothetical protein FQN50_008445 [Emmonsiellopsis sp. PD_5]|nr:hypothetical protein FQN50_008445 [Emmonsiellopsis sp. PD_5]
MSTHEDNAKFSSPEEVRHRPRPQGPSRTFGTLKSTPPSNRDRVAIPTGLPRLDAALALRSSGLKPSPLRPGRSHGFIPGQPTASTRGVRRGEVTEVMGPRGVGKTAFAMGIAASVLQAGQKVVWIDTAGPVNPTRFRDILQKDRNASTSDTDAPSPPQPKDISPDDLLKNLHHFHPPTLAHLLALISHPPKTFPPPETGLIVIDSISSLFTSEYRTKMPPKRKSTKPTAESKEERTRWKIIGNLAANLKKLATKLNCAVITINEMASRFRPGQPPVLHQALSGITWDAGVATRLILYWHWLPAEFRASVDVRMKRVRIAEVVRMERVELVAGRAGRIVPFVVMKTGLHEFIPPSPNNGNGNGPNTPLLPLSTRTPNRPHRLIQARSKRKLDHAAISTDVLEARHRPRIDSAAVDDDVEIKAEPNDQDYVGGVSMTAPFDPSMALGIKGEGEGDSGEEYEWLDEDDPGGFFGEEVEDEDGDEGGYGKGENTTSIPTSDVVDIDEETVLLLENIPDDEEFD